MEFLVIENPVGTRFYRLKLDVFLFTLVFRDKFPKIFLAGRGVAVNFSVHRIYLRFPFIKIGADGVKNQSKSRIRFGGAEIHDGKSTG